MLRTLALLELHLGTQTSNLTAAFHMQNAIHRPKQNGAVTVVIATSTGSSATKDKDLGDVQVKGNVESAIKEDEANMIMAIVGLRRESEARVFDALPR
jgi:hypothetical protein